MSKNSVQFLFFLVFLLSLSVFIKKEKFVTVNSLKNQPYLTLYRFKYSKYLDEKIIKYLEAKKGSLKTIDHIEIEGDISGWRYVNNTPLKKEEIKANFVKANLTSHRIEDFQGPVNIIDALLGGGVSIKRQGLGIYTKEAHYWSVKNLVNGDQPVHAVFKSQSIDSEKGFKLDLENETIELIGPVKGVVNPYEKR